MSRNKFGSLPMRAIRKLNREVGHLIYGVIAMVPYFHFLRGQETKQAPITLGLWFMQKVLGFNRGIYWGVHFTSKVVQPRNILIGRDSNPGIEPGCYIQGLGKVRIGDFTQVAANTSIISANHDPYDLNRSVPGEVNIGSYCWIGANAVVLPDVTLGDFTMVGAGAVVTKSFPEGHCVIAGNPARKLRDLDRAACVLQRLENPYVGYMKAADFDQYRKDYLWV